ncbi:sulfotransferase family 1E member 1 [Rhinolophus ferrumequinum]|uniref:Sulfotransferase family 1E member 1 n=1 Tax=Rhinolophus ferrumequinum TaxID=59479 RepID=A0A7J7ZEH6_RHIFE|nr:sulfotransferase family 1E member 1 [Rhinolophus ferrumequinum]
MMDSSKRDYFEYFGRVHGILMYKDFVKYWDDVEAFEARPDDIVIATYPKSESMSAQYQSSEEET